MLDLVRIVRGSNISCPIPEEPFTPPESEPLAR